MMRHSCPIKSILPETSSRGSANQQRHMHITYDYRIFSDQRHGGISRYFAEIAKIIPSLEGDNVEIFSPLYINEYIRRSPKVHVVGVKCPQLRFSKLATKIINSSLGCIRNYTIRNTDIFHETYYSRFSCAPRSVKRVVTVHDMIHEKFPAMFRSADKTSRDKQNAVLRADHVICVSESTRRDLMDIIGVPIEKISVIHHGYTMGGYKNSALPPAVKRPYILYVGARGGYKNFERLLRMYSHSELRNEFSLVCFGGGNITPNESSLISSLNITPDKIIFLSGSDSTLASLYTFAAVFVYPSLYEGFGIPLLESMSFGCPVACSNTSSMPEVVGNAAELFDPNDHNSMNMALERVLSSTKRARELTDFGYERIKLFSWEKCARQTLDVYKHVMRY